MGRLEGKVAFITGAARGQGRSHAIRLAEEGADIIAVDVCEEIPNVAYPLGTSEELGETVHLVESTGRQIMASKADIRNRAALEEAVAIGVEKFGGLDIVVANAAVSIVSAWKEVSQQIWDDTIAVNLTGTWNTVMASAQYLIDGNGGSIILVSSAAGLRAQPFLIPYVASKHGVTGLARGFALEFAEHNIRVNSLHPTGVDTPMGTGGSYNALLPLIEAHPRLGGLFSNLLPVEVMEPIDVSHAVVYLASDESRYVTSLAMAVDAGMTQY